MTDLADLSANTLLAGYRDRSLSPVDVVRAVLDRIAAWDGTLNAMWLVHDKAALAAASLSEARWRAGEPQGALDGVPITIKENIATAGVPMPVGTAATVLVPMAEDAPASARVREAGAVIVGLTTMPDFGMLSSGLSSFHRLARNPWDIGMTPGGSSAGAGTAAGAGYGPLHLGTDIGGSVRLPAGWCGVVGLKPSFGRVPVSPPYYGRAVGPMTRDVADNALLMSVVAQPDWRDHMALPPAEIAWNELDIDVRGLRIGLLMDTGIGMPAEPAVREAVIAASRAFEAAGAIVEEMAPFLAWEIMDGLDKFWRMRSWSDFSELPPERQAMVLPFIQDWIRGGSLLSGLEVYRGMARMNEMSWAAVKACQPYDYVISPTSPVPAYRADWPCPTNDVDRPLEHIGFTVAANMSGQPAISVNCGYSGHLPIGLQITGRRFDDIGVLRMARLWEEMRPAQRPWPVF